MTDDWRAIPGAFNEAQTIALIEALRGAGLEWRRTPLSAGGRGVDSLRHVIQVPAAGVQAAARALCGAFGLEDPERARPFSGECPACGEAIADAWQCPSCELSFKCPFNPKDPMILFVRENGGFDET